MVVIMSYYPIALSRVKISHCKKNLFNRSAARVTLTICYAFAALGEISAK